MRRKDRGVSSLTLVELLFAYAYCVRCCCCCCCFFNIFDFFFHLRCFAHFPLIFHSLLDFFLLYSFLYHIMPTVCAALHSAPTIDLLIIAAFYSQFYFFVSHSNWSFVRRIESIETHGHINMECMHLLFSIFGWLFTVQYIWAFVDIVSWFIYTLLQFSRLPRAFVMSISLTCFSLSLSFALGVRATLFVLRMTMIIITLKIAAITRARGNELIDFGARFFFFFLLNLNFPANQTDEDYL